MSNEISESFWAIGVMMAIMVGILATFKYEDAKRHEEFILDSLKLETTIVN